MKDIRREIINELHKSARKSFVRRHVEIRNIKDLYQIDLIEMRPYAKVNKGYNYILIVIDVFTKFVWGQPVKSKSGKDVTLAMSKILTEDNIPKNCQSDLGKEFYNKFFQSLMDKYKINHYSTYSTTKASIVERVNRTLKSLLWKEFSYRGNHKWIDILQDIIDKYNSTIHSTIKMKPIDVKKIHVKKLLSTVYKTHNKKQTSTTKSHLKKGDKVRISKYRQMFSKSYTPSWSNEIFTIVNVNRTYPFTYTLKDENNQIIKGGFYAEELQKTQYPNIQLIEQIHKRKNGKLYVSWLGVKGKSWIDKKDIV